MQEKNVFKQDSSSTEQKKSSLKPYHMLMLVMKNLCELVIRQKKYSKIKESIKMMRSQRSDMEKR